MQTIQINRLEDHGAIILVAEYRSINLVGPKLPELLDGWISMIKCPRISKNQNGKDKLKWNIIKETFYQTIDKILP